VRKGIADHQIRPRSGAALTSSKEPLQRVSVFKHDKRHSLPRTSPAPLRMKPKEAIGIQLACRCRDYLKLELAERRQSPLHSQRGIHRDRAYIEMAERSDTSSPTPPRQPRELPTPTRAASASGKSDLHPHKRGHSRRLQRHRGTEGPTVTASTPPLSPRKRRRNSLQEDRKG